MGAVTPLNNDAAIQEASQSFSNRPEPVPLLPGSSTWEDFGSLLFHTMLPQAFTLQSAHPMVSTAVGVDKKYKYNPWGRAKDSTRLLWPVVYSRLKKAVEMAVNLRELHRKIKGVDKNGKPYHALDPEAYSWVHATGFDTTIRAHELFGKKLTDEERAVAFKEWQMMGRMLGVAEKYIFETEKEYWKHFNYMIEERLEKTEVIEELLDPAFPAQFPKHPQMTWMPTFLWKGMMRVFGKINYALVAGTLPEIAKQKFQVKQSLVDKLIFKSIQLSFKVLYPLLPEKSRYIPLAWDAIIDSRKHPEAYVWPQV